MYAIGAAFLARTIGNNRWPSYPDLHIAKRYLLHKCLKIFACEKQIELEMLNPRAILCDLHNNTYKFVSEARTKEQREHENYTNKMNLTNKPSNNLCKNAIKHIIKDIQEQQQANRKEKRDYQKQNDKL